ncbi:DUF6483 family protein [Clostridium oceanicum]|uniref:DUF6483 family protein n=1 Tax=Clostridium oceanicum TaxID=1543 RepID=UPI0031D48C3C
MNIEKLIEGVGRALGKLVSNKDKKTSEKIVINKVGSQDIFKIIFNKLYHEGSYDKAEDLIFDELEKNNSPEVYEIAIDFYNCLLEKSDEELTKNNLPRKEIYQGLEDLKEFKINS